MTYTQWKVLAIQVAEWIVTAEQAGNTTEAARLRTAIWALYETIEKE